MTSEAAWYLARGTGTVALVLLTLVVALGVATRGGAGVRGVPRFVVAEVHRNAALLATVLMTLHVGLIVYDPYVQVDLVDAVLPFGSGYRALWVGLGTLTLDLMIAIVVTSLLRARLGRRAWRAVHLCAYALWPIALLHGIGSGTDRASLWMIALDVACVALVAAALLQHPATTGGETGRPAASVGVRPRVPVP